MCSRNIILQIAPEANITTYDIFDNHGYGSSKKLCATLQSIAKQSIAKKDFDIVHLGLKITDKQISPKDKEELRSHLRNMNYVVAAAGNDVASKHVAYPARCPEVTFDVGAFYKNSIAKFSQFESDIGPKVVAPGVQVFCPVTLFNREIAGYVALSGTSTAAAIVTGFLALVISEFKSEPPGSLAFSHEEIVTVIYGSTYKLADSADWQQKVLLGAIDMRSALFYLHVLREIKSKIPLKIFQKSYHKLFEKMREINEPGADLVAPKNARIPLRNSSGLDLKQNLAQSLAVLFAQKKSVQFYAQIIAELTLFACGLSIKNGVLFTFLDKKEVATLKTNKKNVSKIQKFNMIHDRKHNSLNCKK